MDRISLTKDERRVLMLASSRHANTPPEYSNAEYATIVRSLKRRGLIDAMFAVGGKVGIIWLTDYGSEYLYKNPHLDNPIPVARISVGVNFVYIIICTISGVIGIISLIISCVR